MQHTHTHTHTHTQIPVQRRRSVSKLVVSELCARHISSGHGGGAIDAQYCVCGFCCCCFLLLAGSSKLLLSESRSMFMRKFDRSVDVFFAAQYELVWMRVCSLNSLMSADLFAVKCLFVSCVCNRDEMPDSLSYINENHLTDLNRTNFHRQSELALCSPST